MMYILDFCTKVDIYIYLMVDIISYEMYDECDGWCVTNGYSKDRKAHV